MFIFELIAYAFHRRRHAASASRELDVSVLSNVESGLQASAGKALAELENAIYIHSAAVESLYTKFVTDFSNAADDRVRESLKIFVRYHEVQALDYENYENPQPLAKLA
jgi:hypothetical protein